MLRNGMTVISLLWMATCWPFAYAPKRRVRRLNQLIAAIAGMSAAMTAMAGATPEIFVPVLASTAMTDASTTGAPLDVATAAQQFIRAHNASKNQNFAGTLVVMSNSGAMTSSRIWHLVGNGQTIERIEFLSGVPRTSFRRDDHVITFLPQRHVARAEQRPSYGLFPHLLSAGLDAIGSHYRARRLPDARVVGMETNVTELIPNDSLRYGYRMWTEATTGFAVRLQTLGSRRQVLEQVAFSDLELDPLADGDAILKMMDDTAGYRVIVSNSKAVSAAGEGWMMRNPIAGFRAISSFRRDTASATAPLQWIFSDGLATVSLFLEPYGSRERVPMHDGNGLTHMLAQGVGDKRQWWVTAVGEVPPETLRLFVGALERRP